MPGTLQSDQLGPVDVAVIVFEGNQFNGEVAPALADLVESGVVRIIDLTFIHKDADGEVAVVEAEDDEVSAAFERVTGTQFDLLSEEDLLEIAGDLDLNSSAMVIVWENSWAANFAQAVRASNGRLEEFARVPHEIVAAAVAALTES